MDHKIIWKKPCITYIYSDPFGYDDHKVGIMGVRKMEDRLATYQTSLMLRTKAKMPYFWVGEYDSCSHFERLTHSIHSEKIIDTRKGMGEIIADIKIEDLKNSMFQLIKDNGYKIVPGDSDLMPLTNDEEVIYKTKERYLQPKDFEKWKNTGAIKR